MTTNNTTEQDKGQGKHTPTPGPWMPTYIAQVGPGNQLTQWAVWPIDESKGYARICSIVDGSKAEANARLIAAAPDLLEACKALFGLVESGHLVRDISGDAKPGWAIKEIGLVKALAQAREAIDRAEGKA